MIAQLAVAALAVSAASAQIPAWSLAGNNRTAFSLTLDPETVHSGAASAQIRCEKKSCSGFGTLMQTIRAYRYTNSRVRLSAWVKATKGSRPALWMRVDGPGGEILAFDNMDGRTRKGPLDWTYQEVVLDVVDGAALLNFGVIAEGSGTVWLDDVALEQVPTVVKTTRPLPETVFAPPGGNRAMAEIYQQSKFAAENLDFEARRP